jgi:hypothetical protein
VHSFGAIVVDIIFAFRVSYFHICPPEVPVTFLGIELVVETLFSKVFNDDVSTFDQVV